MQKGEARRSSGASVPANEENCAEQLARFFPNATAVRIPVEVTVLGTGNGRIREATIVEFGGREHAIFVSTLPLEFDDRVRLEGNRKGCTTEAAVIAVQYHDGRKAVAVRFVPAPCDWVTQP